MTNGIPKLKVFHSPLNPDKSVYVQMRQVLKGKNGKMRVTKTKTITIHNATIEQVRAILERREPNGD